MALGVVQAIAHLSTLSTTDGVAYLDVADLYRQGDWLGAVNGNWSPLYSWLLGLALGIFQPAPAWEFPMVKLVNLLIYALTFASFEFLLRQVTVQIRGSELDAIPKAAPPGCSHLPAPHLALDAAAGGPVPLRGQRVEFLWLTLAYTLFIFSSLCWIGVNCDTPDLSTAGVIYLGAGLILRIQRQPQRWHNFLALGGVLAVGYFSKAAMFPLAFIFILIALFATGNVAKGWPPAIAALLVFLCLTAPYITLLSIQKGHPTFSETGKMSYVWLVDPGHYEIPDRHWQGGPPGFGMPKHPTRKIFNRPAVFEFAAPIPGTYPPWTDPSYWYEGLTPRIHPLGWMRMGAKNTLFYVKKFLGGFALVYLVLLYWSDRPQAMLSHGRKHWPLLAMATAGLGLYLVATDFFLNTMPAQPSTRFIAAFVIVLFGGISSAMPFSTAPITARRTRLLLLALTVAIAVSIGWSSAQSLSKIVHRAPNLDLSVATAIGQFGIKSGDPVAILGPEENHVFWARLARARIIAQLPQADEFWAQDHTTQATILHTLKQAGAIAVVQPPFPPLQLSSTVQLAPALDLATASHSHAGWQKVGQTEYYIHLLE